MTNRPATARRHRTVLLTFIAIVCLVAGGILVFRGITSSQATGAPMPEQTFDLAVEDVPDPDADRQESQSRAQMPGTLPDNSVVIPAIGVHGDLVPLGLDQNESLILPTAVNELTWWTGSAPIDAADGSVLLAGHVDDANQGAGALFEVHAVQPGDAVYVTKDGVSTQWKVIRLDSVVKKALPDRVFHGPGGDRQLHIVTCGGPITVDANGRASYRDNVIATAVPF